ncbi:GNAT family N-acetyltransferase [Cetobacterium somerae]
MKNEYQIISERLKFRKIKEDDYNLIYNILKDEEIMYAWGHSFSKEETKEWIEKNKIRYKNEGYSYFSVFEKQTKKLLSL